MKSRFIAFLSSVCVAVAVGSWVLPSQGSMVDGLTPTELTDDLLAWYPLRVGAGDAEGDSPPDASGNGLVSDVINTATWIDGPGGDRAIDITGTACTYNGTNGYIDFDTAVDASLAVANDYTISMCIMPTTGFANLAVDRTLIDSGSHSSSDGDYHILMKLSSTTDKLQYISKDGSYVTTSVLSDKSAWADNEWLSIIVLHDASNNVSFCFDGVCEASKAFIPLMPSFYNGFQFGRRTTGSTAECLFKGGIASFRVVDKIWTAAEVAQAASECN